MRKSDDGLTAKALGYLATQKDIWAERRNSGSQLIPKKGGGGYYNIFLGEPGTPDICGLLLRPGRFGLYFGIETKSAKGKLRASQVLYKQRAALFGVPVFTCRTLTQVIEAVRALREM